MQDIGGWERLDPLGEGGQSHVYLARMPERVAEREKCLRDISEALDRTYGFDAEKGGKLAGGIMSYARADYSSELGALKVFKIPPEDVGLRQPPNPQIQEAIQRLRNETTILSQRRSGLPKLLGWNEKARWIVTEYFPERTLENHLPKFRGDALSALRAFRSVVATVADLHKDNYVHRDIKPANVFVRKDDELVLGDFGIVYVPHLGERLTVTDERVGPRDYMPPWGDLGERLEKVQPNFDVYMLGKLLWCMIAGKMKLPREYFRRPDFNLENLFPNDGNMHVVNSILEKCVVEEPEQCMSSARELLKAVEECLFIVGRGGALLNAKGTLKLPCRICGQGNYQPLPPETTIRLQVENSRHQSVSTWNTRVFICDFCRHYEFFAAGYPEEAASKS